MSEFVAIDFDDIVTPTEDAECIVIDGENI